MRTSIAIAGLILALTRGAAAQDVAVRLSLKPVGEKLNLLIRVPLKAMRGIDVPKVGPGYLDLGRADVFLQDAAKESLSQAIEIYEAGMRLGAPRLLAVRPSLESDASFDSYPSAVAHMGDSPLPANTLVSWDQVMLDAWLEYPIHSDRSEFSIRPRMDQFGSHVLTTLDYVRTDGRVRKFAFEGDPGRFSFEPQWYQAAAHFVQAGFLHIVKGSDHWAFLLCLCLVIPFRKLRPLLWIVSWFTVAHTISLMSSVYRVGSEPLWVQPLIETLTAMFIVYLALENIVGTHALLRRSTLTIAFGLLHGFGVSMSVREALQFGAPHVLTSLVSFNLGIWLAQVLVVALSIPLLELLFRYPVAERTGTIILSALAGHAAWHWMLDNWGELRQFPFDKPFINTAFLASAMQWAMVAMVWAGLSWLASLSLRTKD